VWIVSMNPSPPSLMALARGSNPALGPPSELHVYRGHQPSPTGFIMGHEFTGTVVKTGSSVHSVRIGDKIVSPFTVSWYVNATCGF
jgi:hypothetical protein